jgi:hypothetical protein
MIFRFKYNDPRLSCARRMRKHQYFHYLNNSRQESQGQKFRRPDSGRADPGRRGSSDKKEASILKAPQKEG